MTEAALRVALAEAVEHMRRAVFSGTTRSLPPVILRAEKLLADTEEST